MLACYRRRTIWGLAAENISGAAFGAGWGECYTLAVNVEMGPVLTHTALKCLCTVFLLLSSLPLFPPAPINDPFVRVFLPRWAGRPQQDPKPQDYWTLLKLFSHVLCNLRPPTYFFFLILLFIPAFIFPLDSLHSSHLLLVLAPLLA